jgi:phage tail sheath protein FI
MAFQVSPGVQVREIDLTNVVPAVSTSIGGFAGYFNWGPVEEIVTVGSEKELASIFSTPNTETAGYFLTAASFLQYANALKVIRIPAAAARNATSSGTGQLIKNAAAYDDAVITAEIVAKYPGILGNSLLISICPASSTVFNGWAYKGQFDSAPDTSDYADTNSCSNDELHIVIVDQDGDITGTPGTVLEKFAYVSQASDAKVNDGSSNYYVDVLNASKWVWFGDHYSVLARAGVSTTTVAASAAEGDYLDDVTAVTISNALSGGIDANTPNVSNEVAAFQLFGDAETVDINLLFAYPCAVENNVTLSNGLFAIAAARKDCVAFVSPAIHETVGNSTATVDVKAFADQLTSTSYGVIDSTALKVYDKYNDTYRWIGAAGHMAGLCANTDNVADAWFSPAGFTRGQLLGVTKIAFNPKQADRDTLYKARVNPIVAFPGQGIVLYGDKTAQSRPSAFDRINVRRLFIVLEKAISTAAKYQLFEFNDEFTRAMFRNMVEPFLRDVKGRRGITDFAVVCDETNNTGEIIDTNQFVADIYIKPARSINFITLNFIATRTGVEFSEIIGQ